VSSPHLFDRITIIGLGLIGSSIARAAHGRMIAKTIVAFDHNEVTLAYARKHDFISLGTTQMQEAVQASQLVIIATPPTTLGDMAEAIAPHLAKGCIVMDVCSVKQAAIDQIAPHLPQHALYIPAHPIAGSEQSGVAAGRADMFEKKRVVVCPSDPKQDMALSSVTEFWNLLGARVEAMPAAVHDVIYAYVSHLPQLLAFAASAPLKKHFDDENDLLQKFLRLSSSNPDLWTEIFVLNKDNIIQALDRYLDVIAHVIEEFAQAPDDEPSTKADAELALTALFPRIAASCLITTVMEAEKKARIPFARYAGSGFADFTYPASQPPEGDMESISNQYKDVAKVLKQYTKKLAEFHQTISSQ
jgi:cyclohexadieny/prephenate dehydrogenase